MQQSGVDISGQQSNAVEELGPIEFDVVVTVCGHADENCSVFRGTPKVMHTGFEDPPERAKTTQSCKKTQSSEEVTLGHFRRMRDQIRDFVEGLPASLKL